MIIVMIMSLTACSIADEDTDDSIKDTPVTQAADPDNQSNGSKTDNADSSGTEKKDESAGTDSGGKKDEPDGTDSGEKNGGSDSNKGNDDPETSQNSDPDNKTGETLPAKSLSLTVNSASGEMKVTRRALPKSGNAGLSSGWTLFVYLCGTDLESDYAAATYDLDEMLEASTGNKVRFIVQTGGTNLWNNELVDSDRLQRYLIQNGDIKLLDELKIADMGKPETLSAFLKWGLKEHASEHNGLILWNHGGGSITGVCFDERYDNDSLDLTEIDKALNEAVGEFGRKLDFAGFDACLMGTVEAANVLATFADYMYGSEELEPGSGWDYTAIGDYLAKHPDSDGAALGKTVADSFLKACKEDEQDDQVTFSIIDLSKTDNILTSFNNFAKDLYEAAEDAEKRADIVRSIWSVDDFGGNNKAEGYSNMIDLGGLIEACSPFSNNAAAASKAVSDAVIYSVSGILHEGAMGLSTYYPISVQGSNELSFFGKVCISPYYLSFVDLLGTVGASGDMYSEYEDDTWFDDDGDWYWGDDWEYYDDDYWDYIDDYEVTGESPYITFDVEPTFEEGSYYFMLDDEGWYNTADVYGMVCVMSEDGSEVIEYGETYDINADWESGIFFDNFDGWWLSLPDGQNLATYIVGYTDDSIIYTSPVLLNGVETNLRLKLTDEKIFIEGAWDGIDDECGAASKDITKLKKGDRIIPMYYSIPLDDNVGPDYDYEYYGDEYVFDGEPEIYYDMMYPGEYLYAFCIDDIYGDYYMTDFENFYIDEDGNYYWDDEYAG